jgi:hypothetical protein
LAELRKELEKKEWFKNVKGKIVEVRGEKLN